MYNFSGITFRIWGLCGPLLLLGMTCLLLERPWKSGFSVRKNMLSIVIITVAVCLGLIYASRIAFPKISVYTGTFVDYHRDARETPTLPVTYAYSFNDGVGKDKKFYLDVFSKKEIFQSELVEGQEYVVYYDEFSKVIVRVEIK